MGNCFTKYDVLAKECRSRNNKKALEIIASGNYDKSFISGTNRTALIYACSNKMTDVVIELLNTDDPMINQVDYSGETALLLCCKRSMNNSALKILETNKLNYNFMRLNYENTSALFWACEHEMIEVASKILKLEDNLYNYLKNLKKNPVQCDFTNYVNLLNNYEKEKPNVFKKAKEHGMKEVVEKYTYTIDKILTFSVGKYDDGKSFINF